MIDIAINYWAVLVAAIVNFVVGWLWYGPLFGKMWKGLMGMTDESMKAMAMKPMTAMFWGFVSSLVLAYVLVHFVVMAGAVGIAGAFSLAFWLWLGFMATQSIGVYLWEGKPFKLFVLCAGYQLVATFLAALVLVLWM
ncbi:MAG: DUF1761 domain-containing protein [Patescibacteria group bacterium]